MYRQVVIGMALVFLAGLSPWAQAEDFYAYYTKVNSGEPFEQYSRTGEYADIVVAFDGMSGKLVFWRGSSYLPYWETPQGKWYFEEIIARSGDGPAARPDRVNTYSHVRIVENEADRVLILWRYLPEFGGTNPHTGMAREKFVEEYFEVQSGGAVRRVVRNAAERVADWRDPHNCTVQKLTLSAGGITEVEKTTPTASLKTHVVAGSPVKTPGETTPVYCWNLDEGAGSRTKEAQTGTSCVIDGRGPLWRRGVSGTALQIDGYTTIVTYPAKPMLALSDGLTLEAWAAIGAYPWNWAPIVQQGDDQGYFLGVNSDGKPALRIMVNGILYELIGDASLQHRRWYHLAGTYDHASGAMKLYIDGVQAKSQTIPAGLIDIPGDPIQIGKGINRVPTDSLGPCTFSTSYSFDGLIDEVRIYDEPLNAAAISASYNALKPGGETATPDLPQRHLPTLPSPGTFGAQQMHLDYYEAWDHLFNYGPYADVVVTFDNSPAKFMFWHGVSYVPQLVGEQGEWYNNEWNETWGKSGGCGCQEVLCDKETYYTHVRVLENSPARVLIHWRLPCVDSNHIMANYVSSTGWADWADWYYYIYPDGVAAKKMQLYSSGELNHEWQESLVVLGPGQSGEDVMEVNNTLTLSDLDNNAVSYHWANGPPTGVNYTGKKIHLINFVGAYDPITIGDFTSGNVYGGWTPSYTNFPTWNHWPVAQIPSDGRQANYNDRARHSSMTHVYVNDYASQTGNRPYRIRLMLEGITNKPMTELTTLARSWLQAPSVSIVNHCTGATYDVSQRAITLTATGTAPEVTVSASANSPLYNPAFVVTSWNTDAAATVTINGQPPAANTCRQGVVRDTQGRWQLVVWLEGTWTAATTIKLDGANP